jgi:phage shock protein A
MAPAPDPRKAYPDAASLEPQLLGTVRTALANIASSRQDLEARTAHLRQRLPELEDEARRALRAGRRDVARHTLERRQIAAGELALLDEQLREAHLEADRLTVAEQQLAARIDAILARERMIEARQSVAEIQVRVGETLAGISVELAGLAPELAEAEEHAEALEARAAAIDRMLDPGALGAEEVDAKLAQLERELPDDSRRPAGTARMRAWPPTR